MPPVELVVAECTDIVTELVHQVYDGFARFGRQVYKGIAGPAVTRIDQHHRGRIAALLDGLLASRREVFNGGMHVVRRQDYDLVPFHISVVERYCRRGKQQYEAQDI